MVIALLYVCRMARHANRRFPTRSQANSPCSTKTCFPDDVFFALMGRKLFIDSETTLYPYLRPGVHFAKRSHSEWAKLGHTADIPRAPLLTYSVPNEGTHRYPSKAVCLSNPHVSQFYDTGETIHAKKNQFGSIFG